MPPQTLPTRHQNANLKLFLGAPKHNAKRRMSGGTGKNDASAKLIATNIGTP
jgi:hypothetical protein